MEVQYELVKYGTVKSITREKFGAATGLAVFSGIRGINMIVQKEIPSQLYINNFKCRIYYDGIKERCFACGSTEHKKSECTLHANKNTTVNSYSEAVSNNNTHRQNITNEPSTSSSIATQHVYAPMVFETDSNIYETKNNMNKGDKAAHNIHINTDVDEVHLHSEDENNCDMLQAVVDNIVDKNEKIKMKLKKRKKNSTGSTESIADLNSS